MFDVYVLIKTAISSLFLLQLNNNSNWSDNNNSTTRRKDSAFWRGFGTSLNYLCSGNLERNRNRFMDGWELQIRYTYFVSIFRQSPSIYFLHNNTV